MKQMHAAYILMLAIALSIIPIVFYIAAIATITTGYFIVGFIIQMSGAAMLSLGKSKMKQAKEQNRLELERLTKQNEEWDKQRKSNPV